MTEIYYTVNSGLYFKKEQTGIFIDGIHGGRATGYTPVSEKVVQDCAAKRGMYRDLRALLFTHCHDDHYDPAAVQRVTGRPIIVQAMTGQSIAGQSTAWQPIGSKPLFPAMT